MSNCRICASEIVKEFEAREMMHGFKDTFVYQECVACGCVQIKSIPDNLAKYYPSNYYSYQIAEKSILNILKENIRSLKDKYAIFKKGLLGKILWNLVPGDLRIQALSTLEIRPDTKILDVGCGSGDLLKKLEKTGCKKLVGIDPYLKEDTIYSQNLKILSKDFLEIDEKFDLIMMHHSFEHMHNPKEIFSHIANVLEDTGICMIRIPVADSWAYKHYASDWVQLDAPRHFYLHTDASMEILCRNSHLELINKWRDSNELQFYGSEQYLKDISLFDKKSYHVAHKSSVFDNSTIKEFKLKAKKLNEANQGDQAVYLIRKKVNS